MVHIVAHLPVIWLKKYLKDLIFCCGQQFLFPNNTGTISNLMSTAIADVIMDETTCLTLGFVLYICTSHPRFHFTKTESMNHLTYFRCLLWGESCPESFLIPLSYCRYLKFRKNNCALCLLVLPVRHMVRASLAFWMTTTQEMKNCKTLVQKLHHETYQDMTHTMSNNNNCMS